jgi:hypothetical protein
VLEPILSLMADTIGKVASALGMFTSASSNAQSQLDAARLNAGGGGIPNNAGLTPRAAAGLDGGSTFNWGAAPRDPGMSGGGGSFGGGPAAPAQRGTVSAGPSIGSGALGASAPAQPTTVTPRYTPPVSNYVAPVLPSGGGGGGGGSGVTPSAAVAPSDPAAFWDAIAAEESSGNWQNPDTGGSGHYGGLQFSPETWRAFGGGEFADMPHQATRQEQMIVADRTAFTGYNGTPPQGLGAWEVITNGSTAGKGITVNSPRPAGSAAAASTSGSAAAATRAGATPTAAVPKSRFSDQNLVPNAAQLNDIIAAQFPGIQDIGGYRANGGGSNDHPSGQALDIMIPGWDTPEGKAMGDAVNRFLHENSAALGVESTIWQDAWIQADGTSGGKFLGRPGANEGHYNHVHAKVKPGAAAPGVSTAYPSSTGADPYSTAVSSSGYAGDKSLREAQQKVDDTERYVGEAERKLQEMQFKSGVSPQDIADQEAKVAKARREHADALDDLTAAQNGFNKAAGESPDGSGGFSGQDFMGGIAEFFGFDGSLFKNPAEFGLFKFLGAFSKLKPSEGSAAAATTAGSTGMLPGGGGGGGLGSLLSMIPQPFGGLNIGSPADAPGQFMPTMPAASDAGIAPFGVTGAPGTAGPGNQPIDNSITVNNPVGEDHLKGMLGHLNSEQYPRMRQPLRSLPQQ